MVGQGSQSNPTYSFQGDTDTGIWSSADGNIDIVTDGVPVLNINENQLITMGNSNGNGMPQVLDIYKEYNEGLTGSARTLLVRSDMNEAADSDLNLLNIQGAGGVALGNTANYTGVLRGIGASTNHRGTGTCDRIASITCNSNNTGGGTVVDMYGVRVVLENLGGSTTTNMYGYFVDDPVYAGGSVTNAYGLYISDMDDATVTNCFGVYQQGPTCPNMFEGRIEISPTVLSGDIRSLNVGHLYNDNSVVGSTRVAQVISSLNEPLDSAENYIGLQGSVGIDALSTVNYTGTLVGGVMGADNMGSGNINRLVGSQVRSQNNNVGSTVDFLISINSRADNSGIVLDMRGINIESPNYDVGSSTTDSYGLYIEPRADATVTNAYGVYQEGLGDQNVFMGSVGVGVSTNDANALLQVDSTTQGFLPPRMTTAQRTAIVGPAGLVVYDTDINKLYVYTTAWEQITSV